MTYIYDFGRVKKVKRKANILHLVSAYAMLDMIKNNTKEYAECEPSDLQAITHLKEKITCTCK